MISDRYRELTIHAGVNASVRVCVGPRRKDMFRFMLGRNATVVIGGRRRWWWHTAEQELERELRRHGHDVVFAEVTEAVSVNGVS